ncbi:hypothetical protein C7B70_13160 [Chlorogloea sp. CCALA 695]|nr:hypothetical protein C7B70_13160 [Chlorogloea sp. CCALA 695]
MSYQSIHWRENNFISFSTLEDVLKVFRLVANLLDPFKQKDFKIFPPFFKGCLGGVHFYKPDLFRALLRK